MPLIRIASIPRRLLSQTKDYAGKLRREILSIIKATGPISVAEFMRVVNTHPKFGYYSCKEVFGRSGDFITAPEISQTFGEIIGVFILHTIQTCFSSSNGRPIRLLELGPGRGTLMRDVLRTLAQFETAYNRVKECILIETSSKLWEVQEKLLRPTFPQIPFTRYSTIDEMPDDSNMLTICISNEFFDALPVHIFQKNTSGWHEVLVDGVDAGDEVHFRFVRSSGLTASAYVSKVKEIHDFTSKEGEYVQVSFEASRWAGLISRIIAKSGGIFLAIDYGSFDTPGNTLRAIKNQAILSSPLDKVGDADLSADVDFRTLADQFLDNLFYKIGPVTQAEFLNAYGIQDRLKSLLATTNSCSDRITLQEGVSRLVDSKQMGNIYKVFAAATK